MKTEKLERQNVWFFNWLSKYYDAFLGNWNNKIFDEVFRTSKFRKGARILDAGCGTGNLLFYMHKKRKDIKLYGIDVSDKMLEIAGSKVKKVVLKKTSVEKFEFRKNYFDYIFSVDAFHHYSKPGIAMKNFLKVLKKNGKLVVIDFDFGFLNYLFHLFEPGNKKFYSASEIKNIFLGLGFRDVWQKKVGGFGVLTIGEK